MARLFYEKQDNLFRAKGEKPSKKEGISIFVEKVTKLIPSEIIAIYLAAIPYTVDRPCLMWIMFGAAIILTPLYLYFLSEKGKPRVIHLIMSTFAFVVWAYVTTGDKLLGKCFDLQTASIVLLLFTAISGLIPMEFKKTETLDIHK
jgi:hypothetical protein